MSNYIISLFEAEEFKETKHQNAYENDYYDYCDHCDYCDCDAGGDWSDF